MGPATFSLSRIDSANTQRSPVCARAAAKRPMPSEFSTIVVVPVRNDAARLARCLDSIRANRYPAAAVEIVVNDSGRIIFGRCTCPHFAEHLMNQGPCEHMLALFKASENLRADRPSSAPADAVPQATTRKQPSRWEVDGGAAGAAQ